MTTSTTTYAPTRACTASDVDPEWWVADHPGRCPRGCPHGLAAHICVYHCAFRQACQELAVTRTAEFNGTVLGGLYCTHNKQATTAKLPRTLRVTCELCRRRADLIS